MTTVESTQLSIPSAAASLPPPSQDAAQGAKTLAALLGGKNLTVSTGYTDLEKIVAQLKNEDADTRLSIARQRLAVIVDVLASLSEEQAEAIAAAAGCEKDLAEATGDRLVIQAEIERLEKAVQQNIEDGKIHRKQVEKLKELRERQRDKLDSLENAAVKDEAAIAAAKTALAATEKALQDASRAVIAADAARAANKEALAGAQEKLDAVEAKISALEGKISAAFTVLDDTTMGKLAAALVAESKASEVSDPGKGESAAEREKRETREIAANPANVIRAAMDRVAELLEDLQTLRANQPVVG